MAFLGKNNSFFGKVSPKFEKTHSLILLIFFPAKVTLLKVFKKILGKMQRHIQNPLEYIRWNIL